MFALPTVQIDKQLFITLSFPNSGGQQWGSLEGREVGGVNKLLSATKKQFVSLFRNNGDRGTLGLTDVG